MLGVHSPWSVGKGAQGRKGVGVEGVAGRGGRL